MMRRKSGALVPLEIDILLACMALQRGGQEAVHGFALAKHLRDHARARTLTAHGTLYKALARLEDGGLLESNWESADEVPEGRPRRRLYQLSGLGERVAAERVPVVGAAHRRISLGTA